MPKQSTFPLKSIVNYGSRIVLIVAFLFLLFRLNSNWSSFISLRDEFVKSLDESNLWHLALVLLLMPFNWLLEGIKWKFLNKPIGEIRLERAMEAVLMGVAVSIVTPNRVGEYLGRVVNVRPGDKWKALTAQLIGSLVQLLLLAVAGLASFIWLSKHFGFIHFDNQVILVSTILGLIVVLTLFYFAQPSLEFISGKVKIGFLDGVKNQMAFIQEYRPSTIFSIGLLTFLRIVLYVFQYWLLLQFFNIDVSPIDSCAAILLTYVIQSGIPLPPLMGLLARGEITLFVWTFFDVNELAVLATSYLLWVINVLGPALIGAVLILKADIWKSFGFEES